MPPRTPPSDSDEPLLSVGRLARATGIPAATLRAWERRYGRPEPLRLPSGHRRYRLADVRWLRRIASAWRRGHRPSALLVADERELERRVGAAASWCAERAGWIALARAHAIPALVERLASETRELSFCRAADTRFAPFLAQVGEAWAEGRLAIRHEHAATRAVFEHVEALRRRHAAARPPAAERVLLATLADDRHLLGLTCAAALCEEEGHEALILGGLPAEEVAAAASEARVAALGLGLTATRSPRSARAAIARLRALLPRGVPVLLGGAGAARLRARVRRRGGADAEPEHPPHHRCATLAELRDWLRGHRPERRPERHPQRPPERRP